MDEGWWSTLALPGTPCVAVKASFVLFSCSLDTRDVKEVSEEVLAGAVIPGGRMEERVRTYTYA